MDRHAKHIYQWLLVPAMFCFTSRPHPDCPWNYMKSHMKSFHKSYDFIWFHLPNHSNLVLTWWSGKPFLCFCIVYIQILSPLDPHYIAMKSDLKTDHESSPPLMFEFSPWVIGWIPSFSIKWSKLKSISYPQEILGFAEVFCWPLVKTQWKWGNWESFQFNGPLDRHPKEMCGFSHVFLGKEKIDPYPKSPIPPAI